MKKLLGVAVAAALIAMGGATVAHAATQQGNTVCVSPRTAWLSAKTTGTAVFTFNDNNSANVHITYFYTDGNHSDGGWFRSNAWTIQATTISGAVGSCYV